MDHEVPRFQKTKPFHADVARNLRHPTLIWMRRNSCNVNFPTVQSPDLGGEEIRFKKISVRSNNSFQVVVFFLSGAGAKPFRCRIFPTVLSLSLYPRLARAPTIRSSPQLRFFCAIRTINLSNSASVRGRPG